MSNMIPVQIKMPSELVKRAKAMRRAVGTSMSELIRRTLDEQLTKWENQHNVERPKN